MSQGVILFLRSARLGLACFTIPTRWVSKVNWLNFKCFAVDRFVVISPSRRKTFQQVVVSLNIVDSTSWLLSSINVGIKTYGCSLLLVCFERVSRFDACVRLLKIIVMLKKICLNYREGFMVHF